MAAPVAYASRRTALATGYRLVRGAGCGRWVAAAWLGAQVAPCQPTPCPLPTQAYAGMINPIVAENRRRMPPLTSWAHFWRTRHAPQFLLLLVVSSRQRPRAHALTLGACLVLLASTQASACTGVLASWPDIPPWYKAASAEATYGARVALAIMIGTDPRDARPVPDMATCYARECWAVMTGLHAAASAVGLALSVATAQRTAARRTETGVAMAGLAVVGLPLAWLAIERVAQGVPCPAGQA